MRKKELQRRRDKEEEKRTQRLSKISGRRGEGPSSKSAKAPRRKVKLPIVRSKQPGTLELDNGKIFEIISFP